MVNNLMGKVKKLREIIAGRKVAIAGIGKYQQDFEYVFEELTPEIYITKDNDIKVYNGKQVVDVEKIREIDLENTLIIICDRVTSLLEKRIEELGLKGSGEDYIRAEALFETLDFDLAGEINGRKIVYWDYKAELENKYREVKELADIKPDVYVRRDKNDERLYGYEKVLEKKQDYYFIIMSDDYKSAYNILIQNGLEEVKDFISYRALLVEQGEQKPSKMMLKTYQSQSYKQVDCRRPFTYAFLGANGKIDCCCVSRINKSYGDYSCMDFNRIWNSNIAKVFRLSMINKTYCFCNVDKCFILKPNAETGENIRMKVIPEVAKSPELIQVCMDNSCNLHCLSCRKEVKVADRNQYENIEFNAERLMETNWLDHARTIVMAGNGEVFFSKIYRKLLYENISGRRKNIQILSNGTLFNNKEFAHLQEIYDDITVSISVDSLRKEMYEKLRAGAKYDVIMENLSMLSEKRRTGEIRRFEIFVVVQMDNLYELPEFIEKCIDMNVDMILLNPIHKGGVYTNETFKQVSLVKEDGSLKDEVIEVFENPIFKSKQVSMAWFKNRLNGKTGQCYIE